VPQNRLAFFLSILLIISKPYKWWSAAYSLKYHPNHIRAQTVPEAGSLKEKGQYSKAALNSRASSSDLHMHGPSQRHTFILKHTEHPRARQVLLIQALMLEALAGCYSYLGLTPTGSLAAATLRARSDLPACY